MQHQLTRFAFSLAFGAFLIICLVSTTSTAEGRALVMHRPMTSFAHFLYGTSGVFPPAAAFNRDLLAWKNLLDTPTTQALTRTALWFRTSLSKFPTEHLFETAFYQASTRATNLRSLLESWRGRGIPSEPELQRDFEHLYQAFTRHFAADPDLIQQELARLNASPETRHFDEILSTIDGFFRPARIKSRKPLEFEIIAIPLRLKPAEMKDLRNRGKNSIFGRNFNHLQIIELVLVPEIPDLSRKMLSHLLGVGLHEIAHYFYAERKIGSYVRQHLPTETDAVSYLTAVYLNEGLATALGNGLYSLAIGSQDPQWYARESINRFGHALIPLVQKQISESRLFDLTFCLEARRAFRHTFPHFENQWEFAFSQIHWVGSAAEKVVFFEHLKRYLPGVCDVDGQESRRPMARLHVVHFNDPAMPASLPDKLREKAKLYERVSKNFIVSDYDADRQTFELAFFVSDQKHLADLIDLAFKRKYRTPVLLLK